MTYELDRPGYDLPPDAQAALAAGYLGVNEVFGGYTPEELKALELDRERIVEGQAWGD